MLVADRKASTGSDAAAGVATFLARVKALAEGSALARSATAKEDDEAIALLETRDLKAAERKRLDVLIEVALAPTASLDALPPGGTGDERLAKARYSKGWYDEWAAIAGAVVMKRAPPSRRGLAQRKMGNERRAGRRRGTGPGRTGGSAAG
jgi:hypothetical protein